MSSVRNSPDNHKAVLANYQRMATEWTKTGKKSVPGILLFEEVTKASDNFNVHYTIHSDKTEIAVYAPGSKKAQSIFTYTLGKPPEEPRALWWRALAGFILSLGLGIGVAALMGHVGNHFIMEKRLWIVGGAGSAIIGGVATGFWLQQTHKHNQAL